jgi:hypothetical protein
MAGKKGRSGRKSYVQGFRDFCREVVLSEQVREKMRAEAEENPDYALKLAEHGFGRPPQSMDLKVSGDADQPLVYRAEFADGGAIGAADPETLPKESGE